MHDDDIPPAERGYASPEAAERAFYAAIESADLDAMRRVWEAGDGCACIHPLGPRLQGRERVLAGWRRIFDGGVRLRFTLSAVEVLADAALCVRLVQENIHVIGADEQPAHPVLATNVYRHGPHGWHLVLHHASPGPAVATAREPSARPDRLH
ncbi:ketosteroid isomerase-like protein [Plasticicumulans lactativorans]|uniref:Ketosteroid isomerase-like protein n=1 Tax=Plasticicumulans lactativorans TaxID=1133106 RepID=A0A4R2LDR4_9GAMM|nr:nuclear transport factor 2 family protein [Plasticicumulans lactativorans]TCO83772.1 ketosteroid isomerase-like protein [Plasticicumulans lactativorans]